jgi:peptidyl-prolyl cis-trans isomerase SurA
MNVTKYLVFTITAFLSLTIHAQSSDPIVAKVGDENISKSELEYAYKKSINNNTTEKQTLEQFLQNYIDFKLKVQEAKQQGLDKESSFKTEYNKYLSDLQRSYMEDTITMPAFAKTIYDRLCENREVSHLLVAFPDKRVFPHDTLTAYNKIVAIRKELKKDGSNFSELIKKYSSDTISAKRERPGNLGWITSMSMEYPVEEFIYNSPLNVVSQPIRSNYGYHLVKVLDKRPDVGQINVSHILIHFPQLNPTKAERDSVQKRVNNVYNELLAGANFFELCAKYSDDKSTSNQGGDLGWFGVRNPLPSKFESALKDIKQEELTKPIETDYGFHILYVNERVYIDSWKKMKKDVIEFLNGSDRKSRINTILLNRLSKEIPYQINQSAYLKLEQLAQQNSPIDSLFKEEAKLFSDDILVNVDTNTYTVGDLVSYLDKNPQYMFSLSTDILYFTVNTFILDKITQQKRVNLMQLYPELKLLAQEYYGGILLFDITNKEIWEKAQTDKKGLEKLYRKNTKKYQWDSPKFEGYLIYARNKDVVEQAKNIIKEQPKGATNLASILKEKLNVNGEQNIIVEKGLWAKGENEYVDHALYQTVLKKEMIGYPEHFLEGKSIDKPRNFEDVRGLVIADYQTELEQQWMKSLRKKYTVEINKDALN